jgi:hypothetical protein
VKESKGEQRRGHEATYVRKGRWHRAWMCHIQANREAARGRACMARLLIQGDAVGAARTIYKAGASHAGRISRACRPRMAPRYVHGTCRCLGKRELPREGFVLVCTRPGTGERRVICLPGSGVAEEGSHVKWLRS